MVITNQWIDSYRTPPGGWTRKNLAAIGVAWPPVKGWKRKVIGREIGPDQQKIFETGNRLEPGRLPLAAQRTAENPD